MTYVGLDQACFTIIPIAPNIRDYLACCANVVRIDGEQMEQFAFSRGEAHRFPIDGHLIVKGIDTNRADCDHRKRTLFERRTPSTLESMNTRQELSRKEGFAQVIIGS